MRDALRVGLVALIAACVTPKAPTRQAVSTEVALSFVHQSGAGWSGNVPKRYAAAQIDAIAQRNLVAVPTALSADAQRAELTAARLANLAAAKTAGVIVLVETASRYDSQLVGRYRWTVFAKITVADASDLERASTRSIDLPVTLEYDHQRDAAALEAAAGPIARELGVVVDAFFASYKPAPPAAANAPAYDAIYFLMVDRFANGDRTNDDAFVDPADPAAWHGGDLAGVRQHLGDIARLGATTLWLSPLAKTRAEKFEGHGAFHGYWTEDLERVEPRFGSWSELDALGSEAKALGIDLYLDLVLNHVGPDAAIASERPDWFHPSAPITDWTDREALERREVHGLPDFDQSNPEVYRYLLAAAAMWARRPGVAGFRVDAVRHIAPSFWRRFAADIERPGELLLLGEVFDGNPKAIADGFALGFDQLFDFPLHYAALDALCKGQPLSALAAALASDRAYPDPARLVTFADNHDTPRAASQCGAADLERLFFFLLSVRGTPQITWGTEVGLRGAGEPENRADMQFGPLAPIGEQIVQRLSDRRAHPALRARDRHFLVANTDAIVWLQSAEGETALLGISRSDAPVRVALEQPLAGIERGFESCGERCVLLVPGAVATAWLESAPAREVRRVEIRGGDRETAVVGNIPELALWDAASAPRFADGVVALELPVGEAFAFKLARPGTRTEFEGGENRVILVPRGTGPLRVEAAWRK